MIRWSRSIPATAISIAANGSHRARSSSTPRVRATPTNTAPVSASTNGYRALIAAPQLRQRPRRKSHETTGMLSYGLTGVPQDGHRDAGVTSDSPRGSR
jgi:hypothetical protein